MTLMFYTFLFMFTRTALSTPVVLLETGTSADLALELEGKYFNLYDDFILTVIRNVNIPWPDQGMGDADYMFAFQEVVMPIAQEFNPDLVIGKNIATFGKDLTDNYSGGWLRCCCR